MLKRLIQGKRIEPESVLIDKRPALLERYATCCSCNKKFPDSTMEYYYLVLKRNRVNIPTEPVCKECVSAFTGFPVGELL